MTTEHEHERGLSVEPDEGQGLDHDLIPTDEIDGTPVFCPDGEKVGRVDRFMLDRRSGHARFAVMNFAGFLGMGEELRPVPWGALDYDTDREGYVITAEDEALKDSPSFRRDAPPLWDAAYTTDISSYWGVSC